MKIWKFIGAAVIAGFALTSAVQAGSLVEAEVEPVIFPVEEPTSGLDPAIVLGLAGLLALAALLANDSSSNSTTQ